MSEPVRLIAAEDRTSPPGAQTPGMSREQAIATDDYWMGVVTAEPETNSGWHHHSEHDSYIYVIDGTGMVDFGPGGIEVIQASVGGHLKSWVGSDSINRLTHHHWCCPDNDLSTPPTLSWRTV